MRLRIALWICPELKDELAALRAGNTKCVLENGRLHDQIERVAHERDEARAGHNHHRCKSKNVKIARNWALDGLEHWKERALAAEAQRP